MHSQKRHEVRPLRKARLLTGSFSFFSLREKRILALKAMAFIWLFCPFLSACSAAASLTDEQSSAEHLCLAPGVKRFHQIDDSEFWVWSPQADCVICHQAEASPRETCPSLSKQNSCLSCHVNQAELQAIHNCLGSSQPAPYSIAAQQIDILCRSCHNIASLADTDMQKPFLDIAANRVVNPHAILDDAIHDGALCADCHATHSDIAPEDAAVAFCTGCHHDLSDRCSACH